MDGRRFDGGRVWVIRIDPGEDVLKSLRKFVDDHGIVQGVVVGGYGTLSRVRLHWVVHNRFPPENRFEEWEAGIELLSMNGMIVDGQLHIHFSASTPEGAFGGHLEEGCICYILCEVMIIELAGPRMSREMRAIGADPRGQPYQGPQLRFSE